MTNAAVKLGEFAPYVVIPCCHNSLREQHPALAHVLVSHILASNTGSSIMDLTTTTCSLKKCKDGFTLVIGWEGTLIYLEPTVKDNGFFSIITLLEMYFSDHA